MFLLSFFHIFTVIARRGEHRVYFFMEDKTIMKNSTVILSRVIRSLPAELRGNAREILELFWLAQNTPAEIAARLQLTTEQVRATLAAFRQIGAACAPADFA